MNTRPQIAQATARDLASARLDAFPAVLGFDGFVDDIIDVVAERHAVDRYDRYEKLTRFAEVIASTAGHGCNFELVVKRQKLGGQGPIMGNALALLGMPQTYLGAVGDGASGGIHAVFNDYARRASLIPLSAAAHTHALEFSDGKLMMGELAPLLEITFARLVERVGHEKLVKLFEGAALIGLLNWTMLPFATDMWRSIGEEILPRLSAKPRRIFVDLADPKKRRPEDLLAAMRVLGVLNQRVPVTLGLNFSEAQQVASVVNLPTSGLSLTALAAGIRESLALDTLVIHPTERAVAATNGEVAEFAGPYIKEPRILTGGGDHFNAGFSAGQLLGLPVEKCLCMATAVSGYYVRQASSPTMGQLVDFLQDLPEPQTP